MGVDSLWHVDGDMKLDCGLHVDGDMKLDGRLHMIMEKLLISLFCNKQLVDETHGRFISRPVWVHLHFGHRG